MAFATQWDSSATLESMDAKTFVLKSQDCTVKSLGSCHRGSSFLSSVTSAEQDDDEKAANSSAESLAPLPPQDRGLHAWGYLMSAWVLDFLIWSLPFSYGIFLDFYKKGDFRDTPSGLLALPGSLGNGILCFSTIFIMPLINRFPQHSSKFMLVGCITCVSGLIGAAFSTRAWHLVVAQGVMYSVGGSLLYFTMITYLFQWFSSKRGFANGVVSSGTSIGGVVMPFIIRTLLERYGRKMTLLALAAVYLVLLLSCFPFLRPRQPVVENAKSKAFDTTLFRRGVFWVLFAANVTQGLGSFVPPLYLPSFASELGLKATYGDCSVAVLNAVSGLGLLFFGWFSDRFDVRTAVLLSSAGSALSVLLLWGLSHDSATVLGFAVSYGFFGPSWPALIPGLVSACVGDDPKQSSSVFFIFFAGRGIGNTLAAPVSAALLHPWIYTDKLSYGYGLKDFGPLIIYTGVAMLFTGFLGGLYRHVDGFWKPRTS